MAANQPAESPALITQAEFARRQSVTRQAINDWVARGVIPLHDGKLLEAEALAAIAAVRDPARASKIAEPAPAPAAAEEEGDLPTEQQARSYHHAKTRNEEAKASLAELKLQQERGNLVEVAKVRLEIGARLTRLRTNLLQIPARLAPLLAPETNQAAVHSMLDAELRRVLIEFTDART